MLVTGFGIDATPDGSMFLYGDQWMRRVGDVVYLQTPAGAWLPWSTPESRMRGQYQRRKKRLRAALIERDGETCRGCSAASDLTIDHIRPLSKGGDNEMENLQFLCRPCNSRKGVRVA